MSEQSRKVGPGSLLAGRYEITAEVGRGGFGRVFRARQINMDRDVAVKVLPSQFMAIEDVVERFKREAKLASRLSHPNTITLHDYGQHEDSLFIVMELLQGEDLADRLRREGRLPVKRIMAIARQVLKSLSEAHSHSIVHRDLKPENIFLSVMGDERDVVKVLDFGIAKLALPEPDMEASDARKLTLSGSTVGTPTYMSPEQAAGESVDGQTDLYALGVIMYEMATGRAPFADKDAVKVMRAHLFDDVAPIRDPQIQGTLLERVIMKALEKDRDKRFATASEFLLALASEPVAKPQIQGLDLGSMRSSPTDDSRPNTDKHNSVSADASQSTLQYAPAQPRGDAIPFELLDEKKPEREKETVRSGITDASGLNSAPPGFADDSTGSSILTVIEPGNEDDVILLTTPKDERSELDEALETGVTQAEAFKENAELDVHPLRESGELFAAPDTSRTDDEWSWGESRPTTDDHIAQERHDSGVVEPPRRSSATTVVLLLILLGSAGAAAWYFWPRLAPLLGL